MNGPRRHDAEGDHQTKTTIAISLSVKLKDKTEHNKTDIATDIENRYVRGEGMGWGRNRWGGLRGINLSSLKINESWVWKT